MLILTQDKGRMTNIAFDDPNHISEQVMCSMNLALVRHYLKTTNKPMAQGLDHMGNRCVVL